MFYSQNNISGTMSEIFGAAKFSQIERALDSQSEISKSTAQITFMRRWATVLTELRTFET